MRGMQCYPNRTIPRPNSPVFSFTCTYDAWNRLVTVSDANVVSRWYYDGLHRQIHRADYQGDDGWLVEDSYYNVRWQVLERRVRDEFTATPHTTVAETARYQYVWDVRYIDAAVCRDENTNADSDCTDEADEHLYFCQDANYNVTALVDGSDGGVGGAIRVRSVRQGDGLRRHMDQHRLVGKQPQERPALLRLSPRRPDRPVPRPPPRLPPTPRTVGSEGSGWLH